jgi:integrase
MSRKRKPWYYTRLGCYYAWVNGRRTKLLRASETDKNLRKAQRILEDVSHDAKHGTLYVPSQQTVTSVIDEYLKQAKLAASTLAMRKPYLNSFKAFNGRRRVDDCLPDHMEEWLEAHPEWVSDWTKNGAIRNVQVAFNWAAGKKLVKNRTLIRANPFRGVNHRTGAPRRDMSQEEFQAIFRSTSGKNWMKPTPGARFRRVLIFLWYTGCRPSEASCLTWDKIDFKKRIAIIKEHKTSRTQKTPQPRVIPLHPIVLRLLAWIQRQDEGKRVFLTHKKTAWNKDTLAQRLRRAREAAGVPDDVKLYCTRHAFGTRGVMNGVDLKSLSAVMGHTSVRTCENYIHLSEKHSHLEQAMLKVNAKRLRA